MGLSSESNIFTIGHSLVGSQIPHMMNSMGHEGWTDFQVIGGAPLRVSWNDHDRAHVEGMDAHKALATGKYDALILTEAVPLETNVEWNDTSGYALKFLNLAHAVNPNIQSYLYETWNGFDFFNGDLKAWRKSLDMFSPVWEGVVDKVNAARPDGSKEMLLIPAGQAMAILYDAIEAGKIPGATSIRDFFADDVHPTDAGYYYVTMVHQATLYGKDPSGLPNTVFGDFGPYPTINPTIAAHLQDLAWETVMEYNRDGVNDGTAPDPAPAPVSPIVEPVPEGPAPTPTPPNQNLISGNDSANTLTGTSGSDVIHGRGGDDVLDGKAGADEMHGGAGNDVYWVDNAGDRTIELASQGRDQVHSTRDWVLGANIEELYLRTAANTRGEGNSLDNRISGNSGNNSLLGMGGNDILLGNGGNDTLAGGTGNDTLSGGIGRDTFRFASGDGHGVITDFDARGGEILDIRGYANATALISENGGTRIVLGTNDSLFLQGVDKSILVPANFLFDGVVQNEADTTQTSGADDTIRGSTQAEVVWGLEGLDTFYWQAGMGNDTYHGGTGAERYDANPYTPGNPGGDKLILEGSVGARIDMRSTENGSVQIGSNRLEFTGIERIFGTSGDDIVTATTATMNPAVGGKPGHGLSIFTRAGNDRIAGSPFDDVIDGGGGNDTINGDGGNDFIHSSTGNDLINGGSGDENIRWGNGDADHNPGYDTIDGGSGNDLINIWIKRGDIYSDNDAVGIEGVGVTIDRVLSDGAFSGNASTSIGGSATLRFNNFELGWTHAGNDVLDASQATVSSSGNGINFNTRWGHDRLVGSRGDDTLDGSIGRDTVQGGLGDDRIWIGDGNRGDGARDVLIFRAGDDADIVYGFETSRDVLDLGGRSYSATETQDGTFLDFANGDSVLLNGTFDFI
ncbi:MAG: calcium-binding protein [Paracoccus sp. (in: a-proteobacteria)]|nr:hypothetical protein [Pseudomonadota bacterium]